MYQHVFFDLDHTLWDFETNSREALLELFEEFRLADLGETVNPEHFLEKFYETNEELWEKYNHGHIDQETLRYTRFPIILSKLGIPEGQVPHRNLADEYMRIGPTKPHLMPYAIEILDYLQDKYVLHIVTNGFSEIQDIKIKSAQIESYFELIVTSTHTGHKKPRREIFDYTIQNAQAKREECIMIGDNLGTDILGARNAELDHVFYNPKKIAHQEIVTHEIDCLSQLRNIL